MDHMPREIRLFEILIFTALGLGGIVSALQYQDAVAQAASNNLGGASFVLALTAIIFLLILWMALMSVLSSVQYLLGIAGIYLLFLTPQGRAWISSPRV